MGEAKIGVLLLFFREEWEFLQRVVFSSTQALLSLGSVCGSFSGLNLSFSHSRRKGLPLALKMDRRRIDEGFIDMKINIQRLPDIVAIGITDSRETAKEVKQLVDDVRSISY